MKRVYPVIFTQTDNCVLVEVPDLSILTEGSEMADAIDMARDAIGLKGITLEDNRDTIPEPSEMESIDLKQGAFFTDGKSYISLVDIDFAIYRAQNDNKMVRRNVTIPSWLNTEADRMKINVSKVLQEALSEKVGINK